jgi:predicted nuclease of restriction endonuclease-like (RecB) superfamily
MSPDLQNTDLPAGEELALLDDLSVLIEAARGRAPAAVDTELLMLYWSVGKRVRDHILGGERAAYGAEIVKHVAAQLSQRYGRGFGWQNLFRMIKFAELYPDPEIFSPLARISTGANVAEIVSPLATQLTWTNVVEILSLANPTQRDFYLALSSRERWSKRTLRAQIAGKLYERTVAARGGTEGIESEIAALRDSGTTTPALAFRDPYVLDFLGLSPEHSESDLENAILDEMQRFLIELGAGFAFVARQKRMVVDGRDYHLDLLFYHRGLGSFCAPGRAPSRAHSWGWTTARSGQRSTSPSRCARRCSGVWKTRFAPFRRSRNESLACGSFVRRSRRHVRVALPHAQRLPDVPHQHDQVQRIRWRRLEAVVEVEPFGFIADGVHENDPGAYEVRGGCRPGERLDQQRTADALSFAAYVHRETREQHCRDGLRPLTSRGAVRRILGIDARRREREVAAHPLVTNHNQRLGLVGALIGKRTAGQVLVQRLDAAVEFLDVVIGSEGLGTEDLSAH